MASEKPGSGSAHEILSCPLSEVCQGTRIACSRSAARRWIVRRKSHKETLRPPAAAAPDDGKRRGKLSPEDPRVTVTLHQGDLPDGLDLGPVVAIDTETMGLRPIRDRLCLGPLSAGDGPAPLVQFAPRKSDPPNLARPLHAPEPTKTP